MNHSNNKSTTSSCVLWCWHRSTSRTTIWINNATIRSSFGEIIKIFIKTFMSVPFLNDKGKANLECFLLYSPYALDNICASVRNWAAIRGSWDASPLQNILPVSKRPGRLHVDSDTLRSVLFSKQLSEIVPEPLRLKSQCVNCQLVLDWDHAWSLKPFEPPIYRW